jgi:hypothetical protein
MPTRTPTSNDDLTKNWLVDAIKAFAEAEGFKYGANNVDPYIIGEIVNRYNHEVNRYSAAHPDSGPDTFKRAGYITFWIRKLKPLRCSTTRRNHGGSQGKGGARQNRQAFSGGTLLLDEISARIAACPGASVLCHLATQGRTSRIKLNRRSRLRT